MSKAFSPVDLLGRPVSDAVLRQVEDLPAYSPSASGAQKGGQDSAQGRGTGEISIESRIAASVKDYELACYPALRSRPACEYHNWRSRGVSVQCEGRRVVGVHLYNGSHGYAMYAGPLPYGLRYPLHAITMESREVPKLFFAQSIIWFSIQRELVS